MKYMSHEYLRERYKAQLKENAELKYKDKVKVFLGFRVKELKEMGHPLYKIVKKAFPDLNEEATLDEARITKLFEKVFYESSMKALELTFRLDGSMSDLESEPDYDEIDNATEGVK